MCWVGVALSIEANWKTSCGLALWKMLGIQGQEDIGFAPWGRWTLRQPPVSLAATVLPDLSAPYGPWRSGAEVAVLSEFLPGPPKLLRQDNARGFCAQSCLAKRLIPGWGGVGDEAGGCEGGWWKGILHQLRHWYVSPAAAANAQLHLWGEGWGSGFR